MDKLIQTSTILYEKDIYEKTLEIRNLRKLKEKYDIPNIFFNNYEEWKKEKQQILINIKLKINIIIDEEYKIMYYHGFTEKLKHKIYELIMNELKNLTKNELWSNNISNNIVNGIETFIMSLKNINTWEILYKIGKYKICELIYKNIEWQLCNEKYWPCVLDKIPEFECKKCKKKDNYVNMNNMCINCE